MHSFTCHTLTLLAVSLAAGCGSPKPAGDPGAAAAATTTAADAELFPTNRSKVRGTIRFVATGNGVELRGRLSGLALGKYGFGVRDGTDCGPNGSTAGSYLEAGNKAAPLGHLEDLFIEKVDGTNVSRVEAHLSLSGPNSIVGRTLVIEAWPTDPKMDPNKVPTVACGVIQAE